MKTINVQNIFMVLAVILNLMSLTTVRERILLHLKGYKDYKFEREVPIEISQAGIADTLNIGVGHVSKVIKRLRKDRKNWIEEDFKHVKGSKRKNKVYFLTNKGRQKEKEIRERLKDYRLKIVDKDGDHDVKLGEIEKYLNKRDPISFAVNHIDEDGILDLREEESVDDIFVGREREMEILKNKLRDVEAGSGEAVFLKGRAGIGKTRLMMEFKEYAREKGYEILQGTSYSTSSDPYLPVKEALKRYVRGKEKEEKTMEDIPLFETYPDIEIDDAEVYEAQRQSTFYRTQEFLKDISSAAKVCLFLDDLQWADKATIDLLYYIISKIEEVPLLIIGAYRPEETDSEHPLVTMLHKASRKEILEEIELTPLDEKNGKRIIKNEVSREELSEEFLDSVYEKAKGNPLFLKELSKRAVKKSKKDLENFEKSDLESMSLPSMIDNLIGKRLDRLPQEQKRILQTGAIIGKEVPFELLNSMVEMDELELLERIDSLLESDFWYESTEGNTFHFSNPLLLDTIYSRMGDLRKKKLHRMLADTAEELYEEDIEEYYSYIANQYLKGEEKEKALQYFISSGEYAESVFAHENAVKRYNQAKEIAEQLNKDKIEILKKTGEAYKHMGELEKSRERYRAALENSTKTGEMQRLYKKIGETYLIQGDYDESLEHIEKGLSLKEEKTSTKLELMHLRGWILVKIGEYDEAEEIFVQAQELANELDDEGYIAKIKNDLGAMAVYKGEYTKAIDRLNDAVKIRKKREELTELGKIYNNLGLVYRKKGQLNKALDYLDQSFEIRKKRNDRYHMATILTNMGLVYTNQGRLDKALKTHRESLEIWDEIGSVDGKAGAINNIGDVYEKRGQIDEALDNYLECLDLWKESENKYGIGITLNNIGVIYNYKGHFGKALDYLKESLEMRREVGDTYSEGLTEKNIGNVYRNMGKLDKAVGRHRKAIDKAEEAGSDKLDISSKCELAQDYLELDKINSAGLLIKELLKMKDKIDEPITLIQLYRVAGMVETHREEYEKAGEYFRKALNKSNEIDNKEGKAKVLYEEGKMREAMGKDFTGKLENAKEIFKSGGYEYWASRCEKALSELD